MQLLLVTSAFCGACRQARAAVSEAVRLIPGAALAELDVARDPDEAEVLGIRFTPTVLIRDDAGAEVFRAEGVPTVPQVLVAAARALPGVGEAVQDAPHVSGAQSVDIYRSALMRAAEERA